MTFIWGMSIEDSCLNQSSPLRRSCRDSCAYADRRAFAQPWPSRPVHIVVPYAPGGSTDTVARITGDRLSTIWGRQAVIENKPGAGTNIGAAAVASADPDGYTMFIGSSSLATSRLLYR